jgi:hypothetical protein
MYSGRGTRALPRVGFPIRKSRDQRLVSTSPGLIAAAHVLHRLLAPRHPPCALVLLIVKNTVHLPLWSFQGARDQHKAPVSQNSAAYVAGARSRKRPLPTNIEVDVISRRTLIRTTRTLPSRRALERVLANDRAATGVIAPVSLERR